MAAPRKNNKYGPLLLLGGIGLFLLIGIQIAAILLNRMENRPTAQKSTASAPRVARPQPQEEISGNVFQNLAVNHPKMRRNIPRIPGKPHRVKVPAFNHNLTNGPSGVPVTLTIFDDPTCGPCRRQINSVLNSVPSDVRIVHKYYPVEDSNTTGGLFRQILADHKLWRKIADKLTTRDDNLTFNDWTTLLENNGIPLRQQRQLLERNALNAINKLQADIDQADSNGLDQFPAFVLNDYLIDGKVLRLGHMPRYISRLQQGEDIIQATDY